MIISSQEIQRPQSLVHPPHYPVHPPKQATTEDGLWTAGYGDYCRTLQWVWNNLPVLISTRSGVRFLLDSSEAMQNQPDSHCEDLLLKSATEDFFDLFVLINEEDIA